MTRPPSFEGMEQRLPRENLVRAMPRGSVELRDLGDGSMPVMAGHFAVFNEWAEIDSVFEGRFMERIAPKAFRKTFAENRDAMKVTFNHGHDPSLGDKVLGPIDILEEDRTGASYAVPLFDTSYNRDLLPGLKAGVYGSSFRFRVLRETVDNEPKLSEANPEGLPERTITEAQVFEFGPVTFPAYAGVTASVRSLTDEFIFDGFTQDPERLVELIEQHRALGKESLKVPAPQPEPAPAPSEPAPAEATPEPERGTPKEDAVDVNIDRFVTTADMTNRIDEIAERFQAIDAENAGRELKPDVQAEWDQMQAERDALEARIKHLEERKAVIDRQVKRDAVERPSFSAPRQTVNPFDMAATRRDSRTPEEEQTKLRENAMGVVERAHFPDPEVNREDAQAHIENLLKTRDEQSNLSRWILATGSELYSRAFGKYIMGQMRSPEEDRALFQAQEIERALSLTGASGGFAIPFELDPTILGTSNGAVNPWRQIARTETITVDEWRGVSSAGVTVAYAAEATETTDNAPTLVQPTVSTEKAQAFIPFSIEVGMDWGGLQGEMSRLLADGKDELEAVKFATGTGTNEPFGVITGATNTVNATAAGVFSLANLYALQAALPPRYRPRAAFAGNLAIQQKVRQFETTGGSTSAVWVDGLQAGNADRLLGKPFYEASAMSAVTTVGALFLLYGDFSRFLIVDRIGLTVELLPHLVGTNHRPTGQRGLYAYFRNGSKVLDANAFRVLIGLA